MGSTMFHPKGPLPLFLADFERDTIGWREADKFRYLRVLDHMFHQGGFIPDDDDYLVKIMEFRKGRGWRDTVALIRSKLTRLDQAESETKALATTLLPALQTEDLSVSKALAKRLQSVSYSICLTQKRILLDVQKAKDRAAKSAKGGHAKAGTNPAPGTNQAVPPYLSKKERKKEAADAPRRYAFLGEVIRLKFDDLERWRSAYPNIPNIEGALTSHDDYLVSQGLSNGDKWFHRTSAWLRNKDAEYAAKAQAGQRVAAI